MNPSIFIGGLIRLLSFARVVTFVSEPDITTLNNRALVSLLEAKKRGIPIEAVRFFHTYFNEFRFFYRNHWHYYTSIPTTIFYRKTSLEMDDKAQVKKILSDAGIPVASGGRCKTIDDAHALARAIGFPLVVKPLDGSSSMHVTFPVQSDEELVRAVAIALEYSPGFLVERYLPGRLYRGTVVGKKHVFVCEKERTHVVGDGTSTIMQLIEEKNTDPRRAQAHQTNATLRKIPCDDRLDTTLARNGLNRNAILPAGEKAYLHDKCLIGLGCDVIGHTEQAHPTNKELFLKIAELYCADLIGIDLICDDITKPYDPETAGILEVNGLPHVDLHVHLSVGSPDPIGAAIWDTVLARLDSSGIKNR